MVGVDSSAEQVEAARRRGIDARVLRAEALPFRGEFDAVFSNATLHWVADADGVLDSVWRALRGGGRFVAEMGGAGNVLAIRTAVGEALQRRGVDAAGLEPWMFPMAEDYRARLERHGFTVRSIALFPRPTVLPGDLAAWLETFAQPFLGAVAPAERAALIAETTAALRPRLYDADRGWVADYVRLRFAAHRPA